MDEQIQDMEFEVLDEKELQYDEDQYVYHFIERHNPELICNPYVT